MSFNFLNKRFSLINSRTSLPNTVDHIVFAGNNTTNCSIFQIVKKLIEVYNLSKLMLFLVSSLYHFMHVVVRGSFIGDFFQCFSRISTICFRLNLHFQFLLEKDLLRLLELKKLNFFISSGETYLKSHSINVKFSLNTLSSRIFLSKFFKLHGTQFFGISPMPNFS